MLLENINCQYIRVSSQSFEEGYSAEILKELQVTGTYNNGDEVTENIDLTNLQNVWVVDFESGSQVYVAQVYAKNIFSNVLFPLLAVPIIVTVPNMVAIANEMETTFSSVLNFDDINVTPSVTSTGGRFTVTGLPYNIVMDKVVLTVLSAEKEEFFTFVSNDNIIVNNDSIYLKPSFFSQTTFGNGIYSVTTIITTTDDLSIEEKVCLFYDCTMAGLLHTHVDAANCDSHETHLLLLHYALTQASNNACNCDHMYDIYKYLEDTINDIITEDCGC